MAASSNPSGPPFPNGNGARALRVPPVPVMPPPPQRGLPWPLWLPFAVVALTIAILLVALGPAFGTPRMAAAPHRPPIDTSGPEPLTWANAESGSAAGRLHVRPGFAVGSGRLPQPGGMTGTALDQALAQTEAAAARELPPLTRYGLVELAPATALDHHLTLEPTLLDRNGMLATWGTGRLTSDADFATPLLDGDADVAGTLQKLDQGLAAGTPLMAATASGLEPLDRWQPPAEPRRPDMPERTMVRPPGSLDVPHIPSAPQPTAPRRSVSAGQFDSLFAGARQAPGTLPAAHPSLSDAEYRAMLQNAARQPRDLQTWEELENEMGALTEEYTVQRLLRTRYDPIDEDTAASKQVVCNMAGIKQVTQHLGLGKDWCAPATAP